MNHLSAEVAIVGAGPAGLTAAIALASAGVETALVARSPTASDVRTSALLEGKDQRVEYVLQDSCGGTQRKRAFPRQALPETLALYQRHHVIQ